MNGGYHVVPIIFTLSDHSVGNSVSSLCGIVILREITLSHTETSSLQAAHQLLSACLCVCVCVCVCVCLCAPVCLCVCVLPKLTGNQVWCVEQRSDRTLRISLCIANPSYMPQCTSQAPTPPLYYRPNS